MLEEQILIQGKYCLESYEEMLNGLFTCLGAFLCCLYEALGTQEFQIASSPEGPVHVLEHARAADSDTMNMAVLHH